MKGMEGKTDRDGSCSSGSNVRNFSSPATAGFAHMPQPLSGCCYTSWMQSVSVRQVDQPTISCLGEAPFPHFTTPVLSLSSTTSYHRSQVKARAFPPLLQLYNLDLDLAEFLDAPPPMDQVQMLMRQLGLSKSKLTQSVKGLLLETLGQLCRRHPRLMVHDAPKLVARILKELELETTRWEQELSCWLPPFRPPSPQHRVWMTCLTHCSSSGCLRAFGPRSHVAVQRKILEGSIRALTHIFTIPRFRFVAESERVGAPAADAELEAIEQLSWADQRPAEPVMAHQHRVRCQRPEFLYDCIASGGLQICNNMRKFHLTGCTLRCGTIGRDHWLSSSFPVWFFAVDAASHGPRSGCSR